MIAIIMAIKGLSTIAPLSEGRFVSQCYMIDLSKRAPVLILKRIIRTEKRPGFM